MLKPSRITKASPCLSITIDWSILSMTQYRHAKVYLLIKERMLKHQNSGEPEIRYIKADRSLVDAYDQALPSFICG